MTDRKTLRDYLYGAGFQDENKKPRWFRSEFLQSIYTLFGSPEGLRAQIQKYTNPQVTIYTRGYHKYLPGISGSIDLSTCLDDLEVTEEDHERNKKGAEEYWNGMPEEKQRKLVQWAYDYGLEIDEADIIKYGVKVST